MDKKVTNYGKIKRYDFDTNERNSVRKRFTERFAGRLLNLARTLLNSNIHYFSSYISIKTDFLQTPLNLGSRPFLLLPLWE